jgi:hypothetical protein
MIPNVGVVEFDNLGRAISLLISKLLQLSEAVRQGEVQGRWPLQEDASEAY